jgi:lysophospholipase L1-like esterase
MKPLSKQFLALGDSYTIGESVAEKACWPFQLAGLFNNSGQHVQRPTIIAKTGWTTDELLVELANSSFSTQFDLVSLLIGVNNQYREYPESTYAVEFEMLVKRAVQFAGNRPKHVVVLSIPDWGVTPFASDRDRKDIAIKIDAYNKINYKVSTLLGVSYVDITPISRKAETDLSLIASDGLHPSEKMYAQWAELVFEKLNTKLP